MKLAVLAVNYRSSLYLQVSLLVKQWGSSALMLHNNLIFLSFALLLFSKDAPIPTLACFLIYRLFTFSTKLIMFVNYAYAVLLFYSAVLLLWRHFSTTSRVFHDLWTLLQEVIS